MAQGVTWNQNTACPGWNNPANFTTGDIFNKYSGKLGEKLYVSCPNVSNTPNVSTANTGVSWNATTIQGNSLSTTTVTPGGDCAQFPNHATMKDHAFTILDSSSACPSHPVNRDPNTLNNLRYVPTHFNTFTDPNGVTDTRLTKSIRIGHACGRPNSSGGYSNAEALYYNMRVSPDNAMMYIYYACVFEAPGHGTCCDPAFMIRVQKETSPGSGVWVQASPTRPGLTTNCDTLAYFITGTPSSNGGTVVNGQNGWHVITNTNGYNSSGGTASQTVYYKDWAKVSLNLTGLMYQNVRIEVMVNGCCQMQHYAYGYVSGECRKMSIESSGCPVGLETDVATLTAPRGLDNYVWYASEYGLSSSQSELSPGGTNDYFTFRQLSEGTEADSAFIYRVQADDFRVTYRPNSAHQPGIPAPFDSVGNWQTFRCTMTSALDPTKPFVSNLYANVQNIKPTMAIDTFSICGGDIRLRNLSEVPGNHELVAADSTQWLIYNNPLCLGTADTIMYGDSIWVHFDASTLQGVRVRTHINEELLTSDRPEHGACYSEAIYRLRPIQNPVGGIGISQRVLCDDAQSTLTDTTFNSNYRIWRFRDSDPESDLQLTDTLLGRGEQHRQVTRSFTHGVEPIELTVRNGNFYVKPTNRYDTIWCENTLYDTISVFLHPELEVEGDTIVCQGSRTNATVHAVGVDGCTYQWSLTSNTVSGNLPPGPTLQEIPYAPVSTYYVKVTSPQGCVAWDSIHAYLVSPTLTVLPEGGEICEGHEARLIAANANSYTWTSSPTDSTLIGQDTNAVIVVRPRQNTVYTLIGHGGSGDNLCDASPLTTEVKVFPYPVPTVSVVPGIVDSDDPTVTIRNVSPHGVTTLWRFNNGEEAVGPEVTHTFEEATGVDSVKVTLVTGNELGCEVVYPFLIPVNMYTAWFPNAFTPGSEDENATFKLYSINTYEHFSILIYDRRGDIVFTSSDPHFEWDGTYNGKPLPQGSYVYVCRYRKPGTYNLSSLTGSVIILR